MAIYRYSSAGVRRIVRSAVVQSTLLFGIALLTAVGMSLANGGLSALTQLAVFFLAGTALTLFVSLRTRSKAETLARSTEIELDAGTLTCRNPFMTVALRRDEITQLRYVREGVLVRGKNLKDSILLRSDLDGFEHLLVELESFAPTSAQRLKSSSSLGSWGTASVLGNMLLVLLAFTVEHPAIAVPLCLAAVTILLGCTVLAWTSSALPARMKLLMLMTVFPVFGLLARAYILATR